MAEEKDRGDAVLVTDGSAEDSGRARLRLVGWTPCVGPVLGAILTLAGAAQTADTGVRMLAAYAAGLGVPFFLSALVLDRFGGFFDRFRRFLPFVDLVAGAMLVLVGILLFTNYITVLNAYFIRLTPQWVWNRL